MGSTAGRQDTRKRDKGRPGESNTTAWIERLVRDEQPLLDRCRRTAHFGVMARSLRCLVGRHHWLHGRNPEVGGPAAAFEVCSRCGRERNTYQSTSGTHIGGLSG